MKKLLPLLITALLLSACGSTAPAEDTTAADTTEAVQTTAPETTAAPELDNTVIHYATPVIDGKLDDAYLASFSIHEAPMKNLNYIPLGKDAAKQYMPNTAGTCYYLWDDDYLYFCAVIHDETICSRGKDWRMSTEWPWNDDGAEVYVWFSDEDCLAVHSDAHNIRSVIDTHIWGENHSSSKIYADTPDADWEATIDAEAKDYTVEMRIPLPDYVKEGSEVGTLLEIDDRWAVGDGTDQKVGALFPYPRFPGAKNFRVKLAK